MLPRSMAFILFTVLAVVGRAGTPDALSPSEGKAYQTISHTTLFCSEAVGEDGAMPDVVLAYRTLLKSSHADLAFKHLLVDAGTAGKLYALCGIYYTDPAFFETAVQPFRKSVEEVKTFEGCIISRQTVGSIVEGSSPNVVRLRSRSQSIWQWVKETKPNNMTYDIMGGGWPNSFKDSGGYRRQ